MERIKVLALTKYDRNGASSRLRTYQFLPFLEKYEIDVTVSPLFSEKYLVEMYAKNKKAALKLALPSYFHRLKALLTAGSYDLVWIQKEALPFLPPFAEQLLSLAGIPYAVDLDDAIFHLYEQHRLFPVRALLGQKIDTVLGKASLVIAGNSYLAQRASAAGCLNVKIIPTVVDLERYSLCNKNSYRNTDELRVGWIGTPFTAKYLDQVHQPLLELSRNLAVRLVTVGGKPSFDNIPTEFIPWDENTEVDAIRSFDVGIMPLVDHPFEQGKCGYKLIQYMALGKPVIASPIGVNEDLIALNRCGLLADTSRDWTNALGSMMHQPFREILGQAGRHAVEKKYSLQAVADNLAKSLVAAARRTTK